MQGMSPWQWAGALISILLTSIDSTQLCVTWWVTVKCKGDLQDRKTRRWSPRSQKSHVICLHLQRGGSERIYNVACELLMR